MKPLRPTLALLAGLAATFAQNPAPPTTTPATTSARDLPAGWPASPASATSRATSLLVAPKPLTYYDGTPRPPEVPPTTTDESGDHPGDSYRCTFFGIVGRATRLVYIVDHSGATLDARLRQELVRSSDNLLPVQFFNVVLVSESTHWVMDEEKLVRASADNKKKMAAALADYPAPDLGDGELVPLRTAFEKAFTCKPKIIFFVTDGNFDPKLLDVIEKLNKNKRVHIHTLGFLSPETHYQEQLQKLAQDNGGQYKFITEKDLPAK
jgi:hypothetical protein